MRVADFFGRGTRTDAEGLDRISPRDDPHFPGTPTGHPNGASRRTEILRTAAATSMPDGQITLDHRGRIVEFDPAAERIFGYARKQAIGRPMAKLFVSNDGQPEGWDDVAGELRREDTPILSNRLEMTGRHADGKVFPVELTLVKTEASGRPLFAGFVRDISEQKRAEEEIAFLAYHDKLTGLPNRAMFEELIDLAIARAVRGDLAVSVLYLDIDNFKLVNDSLGHAAGDELIRQIAGRLVEVSRASDTVARMGGDEFLVLLPDLPGHSPTTAGSPSEGAIAIAEAVATRIHESFGQPFVLGETEYFASTSVGISVYPLDAEGSRSLLRNADAAMYRSKKAGPGRFVLAPMAPEGGDNKLSFVAKLREAVAQERWELHYQPIVDLVRGDVVGLEALIRWRDSEQGLIPPSQFIPIAEEMGYIGTIGDWVIDELLKKTQGWRANGLDYIVSFNLSPRQLWLPDLADRLLARVDAAGVDPSSLLIEITESTAMADPDRTQAILLGLRQAGLRIAIDDFGTGYSSLSRLKDLAVDVLKIDRSFVRDVPHDRNARTMVKGIVQLAHSLGMAPLAEGIETEDQWRFLLDSDCLLGQGYYFQRPAPAEEIGDLWRRGAFVMTESPQGSG